MNKIRGNKIMAVARTEYVKWIANPRSILLGVMVVFNYQFAVQPLLGHAALIRSPLNALEPFIAVENSNLVMIMVPIMYLVLMSDFPRSDGSSLFFVSRVGKLNWLLGQVVFALFSAVTYLFVIFAGCFVPMIPVGFWDNGWSLVATKFATEFPKRAGDFASSLIEKNLYNQIAPFDAAADAALLILMYLMILALILLLFRSLNFKTVGILASGAVVAFGSVLCLIKSPAMWYFPMAHTKIALHYTEYFRRPVMPLHVSAVFLLVAMLVLTAACCVSIKKLNFDTSQEID